MPGQRHRRTHPDSRESVLKSVRISDLPQGEVGGQHERRMTFFEDRVHPARYRHPHHSSASIDVHQQDSSSVPIQNRRGVSKKLLLHFVGVVGPGAFQTTGNSITTITSAKRIFPAKTLLFDAAPAGSHANIFQGSAAP